MARMVRETRRYKYTVFEKNNVAVVLKCKNVLKLKNCAVLLERLNISGLENNIVTSSIMPTAAENNSDGNFPKNVLNGQNVSNGEHKVATKDVINPVNTVADLNNLTGPKNVTVINLCNCDEIDDDSIIEFYDLSTPEKVEKPVQFKKELLKKYMENNQTMRITLNNSKTESEAAVELSEQSFGLFGDDDLNVSLSDLIHELDQFELDCPGTLHALDEMVKSQS